MTLSYWIGTKSTIQQTLHADQILKMGLFSEEAPQRSCGFCNLKVKQTPPGRVYYDLQLLVKDGGQWGSSNLPVFGQMAHYKQGVGVCES